MKLRSASRILLLCIGASLWSCASQPARPPQVEASSGSSGVMVSIDTQPEAVVVSIHDPAGIGSAQFSHTGGEFPRRLLFQFYLTGLEQVQLAYMETLITASLGSRNGNPISESVALPAGTPTGEAVEQGGPFWMEIEIVPQGQVQATIPLEEGYIQVEPPEDFYQQQPETWSLSWVDFYR